MGMSEEFSQSGPSYTPYDGGESTSIAPPWPHQDTSFDYSNATMTIKR